MEAHTLVQPQPAAGSKTARVLTRAFFVLSCVLIGVLIGVLTGWQLGDAVSPKYGIATELRIEGHPSGVFQLAVAQGGRLTALGSSEAEVEVGRADVVPSIDQVKTRASAWMSSCVAWGELGVLGPDQVASCALTREPPEVWYSEPGEGPSAKLAHAIAYADSHFDLLGGLKVAATGDLGIMDRLDDQGRSSQHVVVGPIAGVPQKAQAAGVAGVDILVVPESNYEEFSAQPELRRAGIRVLGVGSLTEAMIELGRLSGSEAIASHVGAGG